MEVFADLLFYALAGCFVAAFLVEVALNRRPWIVGFLTPVAGYFAVLVVAILVFGEFDGTSAILLGVIFFHATIGSLAGAGAARASRMWIEYFREQSGSKE